MLFMDIWTWEPYKRNEIERRASEWTFPERLKEVGYWLDFTGRRVFCLYEVEDPKALLGANHYWTDVVVRAFKTTRGIEASGLGSSCLVSCFCISWSETSFSSYLILRLSSRAFTSSTNC
jgi:hypothetical protein